MRIAIVIFRIVVAVIVLTAVVVQLMHGLEVNPNFKLSNFLSFFTIQSNILSALIMLGTAICLAANKWSSAIDNYRGAATLYMTITGITYFLLLRGIEDQLQTPLPWVNIVLHYAFPIAILIDWFISPLARKISFRQTLVWLLFPVAYVIYSLIRGPIVDWYPYPFLDPADGGYVKVLIVSLGIAVIALIGARVLAMNKNIIEQKSR